MMEQKTIAQMAKELWYFGKNPPREYRIEVECYIKDHIKYFKTYTAKDMNKW